MQKDQVDQGLSFKKRARRRLVGAIALVLLMVIILPMMLEDRENAVQEEDVEIIMPTEGSDLDATETLGLEESGDFEELVIQETTQKPSVSEAVELPKVKPPEVKKVTKTEPKVPAEKASDKKVVANKAPPVTSAPSGNKYYVQIGVFSNTSNIKKLQMKLDDLGYKSLTEKITTDNGVKTRLRTESFIGRNEAAIALENIKDAGLAGMVVSQK